MGRPFSYLPFQLFRSAWTWNLAQPLNFAIISKGLNLPSTNSLLTKGCGTSWSGIFKAQLQSPAFPSAGKPMWSDGNCLWTDILQSCTLRIWGGKKYLEQNVNAILVIVTSGYLLRNVVVAHTIHHIFSWIKVVELSCEGRNSSWPEKDELTAYEIKCRWIETFLIACRTIPFSPFKR